MELFISLGGAESDHCRKCRFYIAGEGYDTLCPDDSL